jgi:ATP-dependent protease ClpP protease subunit
MEYQRQMDELGDYLLKHTKITEDMLEAKFTSEWYLTSNEAVELGIADQIINDIDEIL